MEVILLREAAKEYKQLNEPLKGRIKKALLKLELEPPEGNIKSLVGISGYRVRIGDYRITYKIEDEKIYITAIQPRGQVYKGGVKL